VLRICSAPQASIPTGAKNAHGGFPPNHDVSPSYSAFVNFLGHKDLGEKTMLFIVVGLCGGSILRPKNEHCPFSSKLTKQGIALSSGLDAEPRKIPIFILRIME